MGLNKGDEFITICVALIVILLLAPGRDNQSTHAQLQRVTAFAVFVVWLWTVLSMILNHG